MSAPRFLIVAAAALALGDPAPKSPAVKLKDGSLVLGRVLSEDGSAEVVVNVYNSRNKTMTFGVERLPAAKVTKVEAVKNVWADYVMAARSTPLTDVEKRLELAKQLRDGGLKGLALDEVVRAGAADPTNAAIVKAAGEAEWKKLVKSDRRLNAELSKELDAYFASTDFADRKKRHALLVKDYGFPRSFLHLERVLRSRSQRPGRHTDIPLTLRAKTIKGVYTLYVPAKYDPLTPTPLVLALHGGGTGGKDGKEVVGSGSSAMNFYEGAAEKRGFIVVCPTAIAAPWTAPGNEAFLLTVLEEMFLLFNVDENRVYLTGHSMGGFGTWSFGPKHNELFAVIAPMSGAGGNSFQKLRDMGTGVYLYHGADDTVCRVTDSHRAGETMRKDGLDFVYTELPASGHTLPFEIIDECFDFFDTHRLFVTPDRSVKGTFEISKDSYPSFDRKVTADEKEYLGDPSMPPVALDTTPALLAEVKKGGGAAAAAAAKLTELADPAAVKPLTAVVLDVKESADVRAYAARVLGKLGSADAVAPLVKCIPAADGELLRSMAEALGNLGDKRAVPVLRDALKKTAARVKTKLTGTTLDYPDFENLCEESGALVVALGKTGDPAAAVDIALFPAEGLLLANYTIDATPLAMQNPAVPRKKLAKQTVEALEKLANPACASALEKVKELTK